jgi:alpha-tubulin suppressor-like RCC1 family protein
MFNDIPDDIILELFLILPIYDIPFLCNKRIYELSKKYQPFITFKKGISLMSCGEYMSTIIHKQQLITMGSLHVYEKQELPLKHNINNILSTHCGEGHCIIWCKDKLYGIGRNHKNQLCIDHGLSYKLIDIKINSKDILTISCGDNYTIVLKKDGLYGFGSNQYGQININDDNVINQPFLINFPYKIRKICCGSDHTVIMTKDAVYGFGSNKYSQLGKPVNYNKNDITLIYNNVKNEIIDISCGSQCTLILTKNDVYGCGSNINSELGLGLENTIVEPTRIPIDDVIAIKNGCYFSLFLTSSHELYGCGDNYYGQLGVKNNTNIKIPIKIFSNVTNFTCGSYHTIIKTNKYYGCGWNKSNQLGLGQYKAVKYNNLKLLNIK